MKRMRPRALSIDRGVFVLLGLVGILLAGERPAFAGQTQEASIIGQVTDDSGAVIPGVTVSASSPALQVPQVTTVTNGAGQYRLSPLPIGTYAVTYSLQGFQTVKQENLRLTVGFVATVNIMMKVGSLEESVTVSGASPVVDVTSTTTTTQLTKETLELIPSTRNGLLSLMAQTPGLRGNLDVGGSNFSAVPAFHAYGQDSEQWSTLEGVLTAAPIGGSASGNYWDYTTFEETHVAAIGKGVAVPVRGVQLDAIVKSGGNDFHGGAFYSGTNHSFQSTNIDAALAAKGINSGNTLEKQWDASGELGGRILRDKLWFYTEGRKRILVEDILGVTQDDGSPAPHSQSQRFGTGKTSYQMTAGNRFVGFYTKAIKNETPANSNVSVLSPWETRQSSNVPTATYKVEWQGVRGNIVGSLQTGHWYYNADYFAATTKPATMDIVTLMRGGAALQGDKEYYRNRRQHTTGSLSWFKPDTFKGDHELKAGFDYILERGTIGEKLRPSGDYQLIFQNGVPYELAAYNSPVNPLNDEHYFGLYGSDNWRLGRRLTINAGARFARDNGFAPPQCNAGGPFSAGGCIDLVQFNVWRSIAPRVSAAYDLNGRGRSVIKAGWGRFDHKYTMNEVANANPFSRVTTTYFWHDLNHDNLYETGEVNLDSNGSDYVSATGAASGIPDPNEPQPKEDQYFLGFERQLIADLSVRVTGVYTRFFNVPRTVGLSRPYGVYNIPITKPDPGPDGKVGTADDPGTLLTYYDYPAAYAGSKFDLNTQTTPPGEPDQTFRTIEVAGVKRLSRGWQITASYSATKKHIPVPEAAAYTPNAEINTADNTWEWLGRISGAYTFKYGLLVSANFDSRSGTPQSRQVLVTGGKQIPNQVLNVAPLGSLWLPAIRSLDLRAEKSFRLPNNQKVTARMNAYNSLNANTITAWTVRSGAQYLNPTAILPPRIFELAASYAF